MWLGPAGAGHHLITLSTERGEAGGGHLEAAEEMIITLADTFRHGRLASVWPGRDRRYRHSSALTIRGQGPPY